MSAGQLRRQPCLGGGTVEGFLVGTPGHVLVSTGKLMDVALVPQERHQSHIQAGAEPCLRSSLATAPRSQRTGQTRFR